MNSLYEICWMAVEPQYAPEVQQLLHSLRARDGAAEGQPEVDTGPGALATGGGRRRNNNGGVCWDADELDDFMRADKESYRRVRAFCDVLADAPGERLTTTAACAAAGLAPTQLRAALGKFTVWISSTIKDDQWPFGWAYGEEVDPANPGEFHYSMSEQQASTWKAARARAAA